MTAAFPFLTTYDPPGTSEGTLDPLGLYQIADQLAVQLVPAVRERMRRIRFLTAMAMGALVTEGLEDDPTTATRRRTWSGNGWSLKRWFGRWRMRRTLVESRVDIWLAVPSISTDTSTREAI